MENKRFVITVTIQSNFPGSTPVDVTWYQGENHAEALAALVQAGAKDIADESMPEPMRAVVKAVRMDIYDLPVEREADPWCHEHNTHRPCPGCPSDDDWETRVVSGNTGASTSTEHPLDCAYCQAGEGSEHNYQPTEVDPDRERIVALAMDMTTTLADPTQAWDIAVADFTAAVNEMLREDRRDRYDRYDWLGWQEETDNGNSDDRSGVWYLTITEDGEEHAIIVHRTLDGKYPLDGPLAMSKVRKAQRIVDLLNGEG